MSEIIYNSDRYFTVFDFFISHSQLLIRASKNDEFKKNIDLIFFDVKFQQISTHFYGLTIKKIPQEQNPLSSKVVTDYLTGSENHLFELTSDNEKYFVAASFFKIYENELGFSETSLGLSGYRGREKELVSSV